VSSLNSAHAGNLEVASVETAARQTVWHVLFKGQEADGAQDAEDETIGQPGDGRIRRLDDADAAAIQQLITCSVSERENDERFQTLRTL
jgi:hypothetical protein